VSELSEDTAGVNADSKHAHTVYPVIPVYLVGVVVEVMNGIVRVKRFVEAILMEAQGVGAYAQVTYQLVI
jgi:hypothetical protein